ncbi:hypothetical protein [uncultured Algoriphagus sp.]|uniref:hypothetical protein n=1 Tax=uncultured Algoriphagus sp. TaxID=417365 RepID=UPI0030ECA3BA|tara:strand:+ start:5371 stop:6075 length:705 start_codon:yes stop_codon:yes gene_type:complete
MKNPIENICFVMMPFGDPFDEYYTEIYKSVIEECGFKPKRADSLFRPTPIIRDIWEYINYSKILIADITDLNPNVMYELGLAHAITKPVIIISDSIENVPFDLRYLRILIYDSKKPNWAKDLKAKIKNSISEIIESPTDSILSAFLDIKPQIKKTDEISAELIEIKQLIRSQLSESNNEKPRKKFTAEMYAEASKEAKDLYYEAGWEINDIKEHLAEKFGMSRYTADNLFHSSI